MLKHILLFGDVPGIPQLLRHLPGQSVVGIEGAEIRPQYHVELPELADSLDTPFLIQPKWKSAAYQAFRDRVRALDVDLIWANSYSMIVRNGILMLSRSCGINAHAAAPS